MQLAIFGGAPVSPDLLAHTDLRFESDLERAYLLKAYDSGVWDDWPGVESQALRFADEWAKFTGSAYCAMATNGTHTLQLALEALGVGYGDEVIVPGLTWQATASAVCDVNAVPVIVDVESNTLCLDPKKVEPAVTDRTRAVIPVHLYHRMADMNGILHVALRHDLAVIEDCAHTHGSTWKNAGAGTLGAFGSFSFQRSKLMNAGEGGAILTQDADLFHRIVSLRSCGRDADGARIHSGNFRMTAFQAAILRGQLAALRKNTAVFDRNGRALDEAIRAAPGVDPLDRHPSITRQCSYGFVFLYDADAFDGVDVQTFRQALKAELGVGFGTCYAPLNQSDVYYPHTKPRHQLSTEYVKQIRPDRWDLPVADDLWRNRIVLAHWPIFGTSPERSHLLTDAIAKIYEQRHVLLKTEA